MLIHTGTQQEIQKKYSNLTYKNRIWYLNNIITIQELPSDCGTLLIGNTAFLKEDDLKFIIDFAKSNGYCMVCFTYIEIPHIKTDTNKKLLFFKYNFRMVGHCPSSRHPQHIKKFYLLTLQETKRGY